MCCSPTSVVNQDSAPKDLGILMEAVPQLRFPLPRWLQLVQVDNKRSSTLGTLASTQPLPWVTVVVACVLALSTPVSFVNFFITFWQYWGLKLGSYPCKASTPALIPLFLLSFLFFKFFLETGSHYAALTGPDLTMQTRLTLDPESSSASCVLGLKAE